MLGDLHSQRLTAHKELLLNELDYRTVYEAALKAAYARGNHDKISEFLAFTQQCVSAAVDNIKNNEGLSIRPPTPNVVLEPVKDSVAAALAGWWPEWENFQKEYAIELTIQQKIDEIAVEMARVDMRVQPGRGIVIPAVSIARLAEADGSFSDASLMDSAVAKPRHELVHFLHRWAMGVPVNIIAPQLTALLEQQRPGSAEELFPPIDTAIQEQHLTAPEQRAIDESAAHRIMLRGLHPFAVRQGIAPQVATDWVNQFNKARAADIDRHAVEPTHDHDPAYRNHLLLESMVAVGEALRHPWLGPEYERLVLRKPEILPKPGARPSAILGAFATFINSAAQRTILNLDPTAMRDAERRFIQQLPPERRPQQWGLSLFDAEHRHQQALEPRYRNPLLQAASRPNTGVIGMPAAGRMRGWVRPFPPAVRK